MCTCYEFPAESSAAARVKICSNEIATNFRMSDSTITSSHEGGSLEWMNLLLSQTWFVALEEFISDQARRPFPSPALPWGAMCHIPDAAAAVCRRLRT